MKVLIACEESQRSCIAFRERGHEAYSCDIQECSGGHPEWHIQDDVLNVLDRGWDLIIGHPPCTYLANSGSIRLYLGRETVKRQNDTFRLMNEDRIRKAIKARDFFLGILNAPCKHVAVENPVPSSIWQLPPPTQLIQPYMFGDPYKKKTYLWLRGLEPLKPTNIVEPIGRWVDGGRKGTDKVKVFGFRDAKTRSKTFPGIAKAFAEQWSDL